MQVRTERCAVAQQAKFVEDGTEWFGVGGGSAAVVDRAPSHATAESLRVGGGVRRRLSSIAVAVDFSAPSAGAFEWAVALAGPSGAQVVAIHAIEPTPLGVGREIRAMLVRAGEGRLEAFVARAASRGVEVACVCRTGRAAQVVCEEAARRGVDLLVTGDRGLSAIRRAMIGSVADRILRLAPMPVLVARAGRGPGDALVAVAAVDFSDASREAIDALRCFASSAGMSLRLHLVHAVMAPPVVSEPDIPAVIRPHWLAVETEAARRLDALRDGLERSGLRVTSAIERGDASIAVTDAARSLHADIVVAGRNDSTGVGRFLLGSTAERILHGVPCAVLAARRPPVRAAARTRKDSRGARGLATP
ncbi:MAG: hypothetical protein RI967_587 [Planctomycetota bacterium]